MCGWAQGTAAIYTWQLGVFLGLLCDPLVRHRSAENCFGWSRRFFWRSGQLGFECPWCPSMQVHGAVGRTKSSHCEIFPGGYTLEIVSPEQYALYAEAAKSMRALAKKEWEEVQEHNDNIKRAVPFWHLERVEGTFCENRIPCAIQQLGRQDLRTYAKLLGLSAKSRAHTIQKRLHELTACPPPMTRKDAGATNGITLGIYRTAMCGDKVAGLVTPRIEYTYCGGVPVTRIEHPVQ